jgi:hypothetical protein
MNHCVGSQRVERDLANRVKMWIRFRNSIARRTRMLFNSFVSQKGYSGHIEFDFVEKTLDVKVPMNFFEFPQYFFSNCLRQHRKMTSSSW